MIKSINDGYVTFEWHDGETHCLNTHDYNRFAIEHNMMFVNKCNICGNYFQTSDKNFYCCPTCYI